MNKLPKQIMFIWPALCIGNLLDIPLDVYLRNGKSNSSSNWMSWWWKTSSPQSSSCSTAFTSSTGTFTKSFWSMGGRSSRRRSVKQGGSRANFRSAKICLGRTYLTPLGNALWSNNNKHVPVHTALSRQPDVPPDAAWYWRNCGKIDFEGRFSN